MLNGKKKTRTQINNLHFHQESERKLAEKRKADAQKAREEFEKKHAKKLVPSEPSAPTGTHPGSAEQTLPSSESSTAVDVSSTQSQTDSVQQEQQGQVATGGGETEQETPVQGQEESTTPTTTEGPIAVITEAPVVPGSQTP